MGPTEDGHQLEAHIPLVPTGSVAASLPAALTASTPQCWQHPYFLGEPCSPAVRAHAAVLGKAALPLLRPPPMYSWLYSTMCSCYAISAQPQPAALIAFWHAVQSMPTSGWHPQAAAAFHIVLATCCYYLVIVSTIGWDVQALSSPMHRQMRGMHCALCWGSTACRLWHPGRRQGASVT